MPVHIREILENILSKKPQLSKVVDESHAARLWREVSDREGLGGAEPSKVINGVLYVIAKNSVLAQELSMRKPQLLGSVNSMLGKGEVLKDIRFEKRTGRGE
jgi:predicted nucleic acid-binding Zn ribbon protein